MGEMRTLGLAGDARLSWSSAAWAEVEAARQAFNALVAKGYRAYALGAKGEREERVTKFDPGVERLILIPPMRGG